MTHDLRREVTALAANFATAILKAIYAANLRDILAETSDEAERGAGDPNARRTPLAGGGQAATLPAPAKRGPGRPRKDPTANPTKPRRGKPGRLARRSAGDIAEALRRVVAHVKSTKTGLRAEQIREQLGMDRKELPRLLKEGLGKKLLKSKGQKRATTYSAR